MLADISMFENFMNGATTATGMLGEYAQTKQAVEKCRDVIDSLDGENEGGVSTLLGAVADSKYKLETEMFSLRRKIIEELEDSMTDEERRTLLMLDPAVQEDFMAIIGSDAILRRAQEMCAHKFNNDL